MKLADFSIEGGEPKLENIRTLRPGVRKSFYESHSFSPDDKKILFCGNLARGQKESGMDIYEMELSSGRLNRLTKTFDDWDEHAHYSPDGAKIAWMSSRGLNVKFPGIKMHEWKKYLKTELWIMDSDGSNQQRLTYFNEPGHPEYMNGARVIVSDSAWSPDGKKIVALLGYKTQNSRMKSKIVMIELGN